MKRYLKIVADHNDADYLVSLSEITEKQLNQLKPLFKAIKNFNKYQGKSGSGLNWDHHHNWPQGEYGHRPDLGEKSIEELYGDVCDEDTLEMFSEMVPTYEGNVHTIKSIKLFHVIKETELL